jgi:tungstate transport system substrate-binding protein
MLKVFGVAVTAYEDAIDKAASPEELKKAEAEVKARLEEITALIERLGLACYTGYYSYEPVLSSGRRKSREHNSQPVDHHQHTGLRTVGGSSASLREKERLQRKSSVGGTGQALALEAKGEADVALVHAPRLEKKYIAAGKFLNRRLVMYNDFIILGPADDPATIKTIKSSVEALKLIASTGSRFVSRGDNSGTHTLEKSLWKMAGVEPKGTWYIESGQGMGATLGIANDRNGYTLSDRGTYLAFRKRVTLAVLLAGDKPLLNIYSVMEVNPANGPRVNTVGGKAFAFMVSSDAQAVIKTFGLEKFGEALFIPVAGKREEEVGG